MRKDKVFIDKKTQSFSQALQYYLQTTCRERRKNLDGWDETTEEKL